MHHRRDRQKTLTMLTIMDETIPERTVGMQASSKQR
jgi:hypothetical protein